MHSIIFQDYSMNRFLSYFEEYTLLSESVKANTHLTHLEELVLTKGKPGYDQARVFLVDILSHLRGKSKRKINTSIKWDGAPAIFVGKHPQTNKFFVGTKSVFNKEPKINYTDHDIEMNHSSPGLVDKLKRALKYLPQLGIKGILQGDFMFDSTTINKEEIDGVVHYTFKPNTIKYAVEANSDLGREIGNSVFGIVFHTSYDSLDGTPHFGVNVSNLKKVPGVWVDDAYFKESTGTVTLTPDEVKQVKDYIKTADSIKINYKNLPLDLMNIYLNTEIRTGAFIEDPQASYTNFITWFKNRMEKEISSRKSKIGKERVSESFKKKLAEVEQERENIINLFKVSKLLQQAKNIFVHKYNNAVYATKHFYDNGDGTLSVAAPEGYVAIDRDGNAVKLVDRLTFSRANFNTGKPTS